MNFSLTIRSFRLTGYRAGRLVQLLFLLLFGLRLAALLCPWASHDFTPFMRQLNSGVSDPVALAESISSGNLLALALMLLSTVIAYYLALYLSFLLLIEWRREGQKPDETSPHYQDLLYLAELRQRVGHLRRELLHLQESTERKPNMAAKGSFSWQLPSGGRLSGSLSETEWQEEREAWQRLDGESASASHLALTCLRRAILPQLLLLLLIIVLLPLTAFLAFLPLLVLLLTFFFAPLDHGLFRQGLWTALKRSRRKTRGFKFIFFLQLLMPFFLLNSLSVVPMLLYPNSYYSLCLLDSLIYTFACFVLARLWAFLYWPFAYAGNSSDSLT